MDVLNSVFQKKSGNLRMVVNMTKKRKLSEIGDKNYEENCNSI